MECDHADRFDQLDAAIAALSDQLAIMVEQVSSAGELVAGLANNPGGLLAGLMRGGR